MAPEINTPRESAQGTPRPAPSCPHPACPACPLLRLPYAEQLAAKRAQVARAFEACFLPRGLQSPAVLPVQPSAAVLGYRAGAKLAFSRRGQRVGLGVYRRGTHEVVDVPGCPVHHPLVAAGVRALRELVGAAPALVSAGVGGQGELRYAGLQASLATDRLFVTLVTRSREARGTIGALAARLVERLPEIAGIAWNLNPSEGNEIFGAEWEIVRGESWIREELGDLVFRASPPSFLQANRPQAGWVYHQALAWLSPSPNEEALDLYSGVGGLALHLARAVARVVAVEGSAAAADDGRWSASQAGIGNVDFKAGRTEEILPRLLADGLRPSVVTLNPPRRGADPSVMAAVDAASPRAILYVSCNPESLARDAALLCAGGRYRIEMLQPVDFFPQTEHIETAALFRRVS